MEAVCLPRPDRRFAIQKWPNYIRNERRLCLTRIKWNRGTPGDGKGWSSKLSISIQFVPRDMWLGLFTKKELFAWTAWLCLIPCFPVRIRKVVSYGGRFV